MTRGPYDVWAPSVSRVRLSLGDALVEMTMTGDGWWSPGDNVPDVSDGDTDYGFLLDDGPRPLPDPRSRRQPDGVHERSRTFDPAAHAWQDDSLDRPAARRLGHLRAARRHLHPGGHARRRARQARPPPLDRRRLRRADAGQRRERHPQLGVRRRAVVGGARAVRRPRGVPALRRRLPRRRAGRDPGRRLQPPRAVRELPARVRPLPQDRPEHLGRPAQPRRRGLGRGTPADPRQRPDVARGLPRRRAPARCRARARRRVGAPPAAGDGARGGRAVRPPAPAADPDRGVRPQRPVARDSRARPAATACTPSGATTSTMPCTSP